LPKDSTAQTPRISTIPRTPKREKSPDAPFRVLVVRVGKSVEEKKEAYEER
jgi:hypothetical protein